MVLHTMPPHPRSNDFAMTRALVPGGPDPRTNGLSNSMPLTVIASDGAIGAALPTRATKRGSRSPTYLRTGDHSKCRSNSRSHPGGDSRGYPLEVGGRASLPRQRGRVVDQATQARR